MSSEVQFDFGKEQRPEYSQGSRLSRLVMKLSGGLVKDEEQARYVLLGVAIFAFTVSLFLFLGGKNQDVPPIKDTIPFTYEKTI